jgi:hypothetical protein
LVFTNPAACIEIEAEQTKSKIGRPASVAFLFPTSLRSVRRRSRNMSRYPIVLKDYGIVAYFARGFRYNEQALVYSGLLARNAALTSEIAGFIAVYRLKDRPQ